MIQKGFDVVVVKPRPNPKVPSTNSKWFTRGGRRIQSTAQGVVQHGFERLAPLANLAIESGNHVIVESHRGALGHTS